MAIKEIKKFSASAENFLRRRRCLIEKIFIQHWILTKNWVSAKGACICFPDLAKGTLLPYISFSGHKAFMTCFYRLSVLSNWGVEDKWVQVNWKRLKKLYTIQNKPWVQIASVNCHSSTGFMVGYSWFTLDEHLASCSLTCVKDIVFNKN